MIPFFSKTFSFFFFSSLSLALSVHHISFSHLPFRKKKGFNQLYEGAVKEEERCSVLSDFDQNKLGIWQYFLLLLFQFFSPSFVFLCWSWFHFPFLFLPLKKQFRLSSYKPIHHAFDYNYIQTSSLISANAAPLPGELQFLEEEQHSGKRMSMMKTEPDESSSAPHMWTSESVSECVKTAGKFPWARPNWKLIIFSLCFLSCGGSATQRTSLRWDLEETVVNV